MVQILPNIVYVLALIFLVPVGRARTVLRLAAANHERSIGNDALYARVVIQFWTVNVAAALVVLAKGEVRPHQAKGIILLRSLLGTIHHQLLDRFEVQFVVEVRVRYVVYARVPIET